MVWFGTWQQWKLKPYIWEEKTTGPWESQYLMLKQKKRNLQWKLKRVSTFSFFFSDENSITEREELRKEKMVIHVKCYREIKQDKGKQCPVNCAVWKSEVRSQKWKYQECLLWCARPVKWFLLRSWILSGDAQWLDLSLQICVTTKVHSSIFYDPELSALRRLGCLSIFF